MTHLKFLKVAAIRAHCKEKQMKSSKQFEARLNYEIEQLFNKAMDRAWSQRTGKQRRRTLWAMDL